MTTDLPADLVRLRKEVMRLMREEFDPTPPGFEGRGWDDNAEDVADKILREAGVAEMAKAAIDVMASLAAAISLLERGSKKAAPSDKMFDQMIIDYRNSLERARAALSRYRGKTETT